MNSKLSKKLIAPLFLVALITAACGSSDDSQEASAIVVESVGDVADDTTIQDEGGLPEADSTDVAPAGTDEEQALEFAQCMRDGGIDFPDPAVNADGSVDFFGGGPDGDGRGFRNDPNFEDAIDQCGELIEGASFLPNQGDFVEQEDTFLKLAECLRENGLDVADPDFSGAGGPGGLFGDNFDPDSPAAAAAIDACQDIFAGLGAGAGGN